MALLAHIVAGGLGLVAGFVALYAAKGARLHRKAGMVFVCSMLAMTTTGTVMAAARNAWPALNVPAALITAYLVITGLSTVRPSTGGTRRLAVVAMLVALAVGVFTLALGLAAVAAGGEWRGMPAFPFFLFGVIGLSGAVGDLRLLRSGPPEGTARVARHLWRMSLALFIAAMSFFIGQSDEVPKAFRIMPLLAVPPLAVLATMLYWLWRVRFRRPRPAMAAVAAAEVA
jgi:uncharacterized membrane protein